MLDVLIPAIHSHVQIVVVIQEPDFGLICRRCAWSCPLGEVRRGNRLLPDGFLQMTVKCDLLRDPDRGYIPVAPRRFVINRRGDIRAATLLRIREWTRADTNHQNSGEKLHRVKWRQIYDALCFESMRKTRRFPEVSSVRG